MITVDHPSSATATASGATSRVEPDRSPLDLPGRERPLPGRARRRDAAPDLGRPGGLARLGARPPARAEGHPARRRRGARGRARRRRDRRLQPRRAAARPRAAPVDVLEEIAAAVDGGCEIWVDGGVRRGLDVVTALALGARGVLVGRPVLWALAAGGEAGVARALAILREETELALALLGCPSVRRRRPPPRRALSRVSPRARARRRPASPPRAAATASPGRPGRRRRGSP